MKLAIILTLIVAIYLPQMAQADRVNRRQYYQQGRIYDGVKSGQLTRGEVRSLERQQIRINRFERRAKADGVMTNRERAKLEFIQDRASKRIYNAKHNSLN